VHVASSETTRRTGNRQASVASRVSALAAAAANVVNSGAASRGLFSRSSGPDKFRVRRRPLQGLGGRLKTRVCARACDNRTQMPVRYFLVVDVISTSAADYDYYYYAVSISSSPLPGSDQRWVAVRQSTGIIQSIIERRSPPVHATGLDRPFVSAARTGSTRFSARRYTRIAGGGWLAPTYVPHGRCGAAGLLCLRRAQLPPVTYRGRRPLRAPLLQSTVRRAAGARAPCPGPGRPTKSVRSFLVVPTTPLPEGNELIAHGPAPLAPEVEVCEQLHDARGTAKNYLNSVHSHGSSQFFPQFHAVRRINCSRLSARQHTEPAPERQRTGVEKRNWKISFRHRRCSTREGTSARAAPNENSMDHAI